MQTRPSRWFAAVLLCAGLGLAPAPVRAHAIIVAATPAANAVLHAAATPVELRFNSRIDKERSRLTLLKPDGTALTLPIAADNAPDTLVTRLTGLAPGQYRLRWQVLAIDGHITRGDIPFEVAAR